MCLYPPPPHHITVHQLLLVRLNDCDWYESWYCMVFYIFQVFRVYYDRLVDDKDRDWLFTFTRDVCKDKLREDFDQLFIHLDFDNDGKVTEDDLRSLVYCDFADPKSDSKHYVEVRDLEQLRHVVEGYLDEFNNMSKKPMNLVLFRFVCVFFHCYIVSIICSWDVSLV